MRIGYTGSGYDIESISGRITAIRRARGSDPPLSSQQLCDLIRTTLEDITRTHRCHERERERLAERSQRLKGANVALLSISSTSILATLFAQQGLLMPLTALTTFSSLAISLWQQQFDPDSRASAHKDAADKYYALRNSCRKLVASISELDDADLRDEYSKVLRDLDELTATSLDLSLVV